MGTHILAALLLDSLFGDPKGLPHPVVYVGRVISFWEKILYSTKNGRLHGVLFCTAVIISVETAVFLLLGISLLISPYLKEAVKIYLLYAAVAFRSLKDESMPVYKALKNNDIAGARKSLSYIVGRDTARLDEKSIIRATVETIAENYVDGVVSVLFYMLLGSFAGHAALFAWFFKAVSTMDSMVGYDDERYHDFGWAAAKFDDVLNFIPARIGGAVAVAAGGLCGFNARDGWRIFLRDRKKHSSPNSAHGESAFAGLLGISLGGGAFYEGKFEARPTLGDDTREPAASDILGAHKIMTASVALCALMILLTGVFFDARL